MEMVTLESAGFLALQQGSDALAAMEANCADGDGFGESSLTKVSTPAGGATNWTVDELEGEKTYKELTGILVYYGRGGVVWPSFEPKAGTLPVLRTDDCRTAYRVGDELGDISLEMLSKYQVGEGLYDWKALAEANGAPFGFGSGKGGSGKRAQEYRVLCLLRKEDAFPLLIRAKPGSLKNVTQFVNKLTAAGIPFYRAEIALTLEKAQSTGGQPFSRIVPKLLRKLDVDAGLLVKRTYTDRLAAAIRSLEVGEDDDTSEE